MATQEISAFSNFSGTNEQGYVIVGGSNGVEGGKKILSDIIPVVPEQVQADWKQDDSTKKDYIKNKPDIPQIDEETIIINDENKLAVAKPIPDSMGYAHSVLTVDTNDGDLTWQEPIVYKAGNGLYYSSGGGYITFQVDIPVPDPNPDAKHRATDGSVLTYDYDSDKIVWAEPQTFELPTDPLSPAQAFGGELIALTKEWVNTGTEANPNWGWSDLKWSYVKPA